MSAGAHSVIVSSRYETTSPTASNEFSDAARHRIRLITFAALALYATVRWGTLMRPTPTARLLGLFALAVAITVCVPLARRFGSAPAILLTIALCLVAFPVAGLQWHSFVHLRLAVGAGHIGDGLAALPTALVPYTGSSSAVRLVIALGAAILLLDAAIVLAFAPAQLGDARRAAAALPLVALAVVPSTLVRPQFPYLQGLTLFVLLAAFIWAERIRRDAVMTALVLAALAGVAAALVAPRLDQHTPWLNYRAWTGTAAAGRIDSFNWNQTYGPLHWPHEGHEVLAVNAKTGDYWKAENLDMFNGIDWVLGESTVQPTLPAVSDAALAAWTQRIRVTIEGMRTNDVIASGEASRPASVPGGAQPGVDTGRWVTSRTLGPGTSYTVTSYSPHPTAFQLRHAGNRYPDTALIDDLTLSVPQAGLPPQEFTQVTFGPFHHQSRDTAGPSAAALMAQTPYAGAYALAQQLAVRAKTPYGFVSNVLDYLAHGYTYDQSPPTSRYPLINFLFGDKKGYCQQFSGAMALLLRMGGLPTRVAAGFTSGTRSGVNGPWIVSDFDAHAWVEVWFPHYGWVRFDPTPTVAPARGGGAVHPIQKVLPNGAKGAAATPTRQAQPSSHSSTAAGHRAQGGLNPLLIIAALAALALLAWLIRGLLRPAPSTEQLLDELERAMVRTGRPLGRGVTLAVLEHRFRDSPDAAGYIRSLRLTRYGGVNTRPTRAGRRALREQLRRDLGLTGRMRSLWALPPRLLFGPPRLKS